MGEMSPKQILNVVDGFEELKMIVAFMTERLRTDKDAVLTQGPCNFLQHESCICGGEMSDRSIPNNHVILVSRKRFSYRIAQAVGNIRPGIGPFRFADGRRFDIDRIHLSALRAEKVICQKTVTASDVENNVRGPERFRAVECTSQLVGMHRAGAESKQEPHHSMIGEVGLLSVEFPQAAKKTLVILS
jgi:hypothetical protein